jgi:hypothetical protein
MNNLSTTFVANFTSFYQAAEKATVHLEQIAVDSDKVQKALNRTAASFTGDRLIREATLSARALDQMGGASILTAKEAERLGKSYDEAIRKMQAMGVEVPPELAKVAAELAHVQASQEAATLEANRFRDAEIKAAKEAAEAAKKPRQEWEHASKKLNEFASAARAVGAGLTASITLPILGISAAAVKLGMDAVESENLVSVSFGDMRAKADAWSKSLSASLGLNQFELRKTAGVLFTMTTGMGIGRDAAFAMSTGVAQLAADMASFRNIPMEDALAKIKSGLTGEAEPLKQIGILVDDNTTKTYAYANGIAKQGEELTQQQKVMARYGLIMKQTANDQGDLARTIDSPANQLRLLRSRVEEAGTSLGIALMPAVKVATDALAKMVPYIQRAAEWFEGLSGPSQAVVITLAGIAAAAGPVLLFLGSAASAIAALIPLMATLGVEITTVTGGLNVLLGVVISAAIAARTQKVADTWEYLKLRVQGYSSAQAHATVDAARAAQVQAEAAKATAGSTQELDRSTAALQAEIAAQTAASQAQGAVTAARKEAAKAAKEYRDAVNKIGEAYRTSGLSESDRILVDGLRQVGAVSALSSEAQQRLAKDVADLVSRFENLGQKVPPHIQRIYDETVKLVTLPELIKKALAKADSEMRESGARLSADTMDRVTLAHETSFAKLMSGMDAADGVSQKFLETFGSSTEIAIAKADEWREKSLKAIEPLRTEIPGVYESARRQIEQVYARMESDARDTSKRQVSIFGRFFAQAPDVIAKAIQGGGDVMQALTNLFSSDIFNPSSGVIGKRLNNSVNSLATHVGGSFGQFLGVNLANMIPMIGSLIGPLMGPAIAGIKKLFGGVSPEVQAARVDVDKFQQGLAAALTTAQRGEAAAAGGTQWAKTTIAVRDAYLSVGKTAAEADEIINRLWDTSNPEIAKAAMQEINAVLEQTKKAASELDSALNGALKEAIDLGVRLPDELSLSIDRLVDMGRITGDNATLFAQLSGQTGTNFKAMEDAAKKFGVELSALGPAFQQNHLNTQAAEIIDAFKAMRDGGADVVGVITGMSDEINTFVADTLKAGGKVPENMRPILETMLAQGRLTDENGNKLEDLSRINFGAPIETAMDRVIAKLQELIDKISGGLGFDRATQAAQTFAEQAADAIESIPTHINMRFNGESDSGTEPGYATGTMGRHGSWFRNFGSGTVTMLHGTEAVVRRDQAAAFAAANGAGNAEMVDELRSLRADMLTLPQHMARAVRDAVLVAG